MHLLVHLFPGDAGEVEEEADVLQIEQVAPVADGIDSVVDGADDLDLLLVALLHRGAVIEGDLGTVRVAVARETTVRGEELVELVLAGAAFPHGGFLGTADVQVQHEAAVFARCHR